MISLAVALLLGLADAQVELSARQNDAQFERRQTVKKTLFATLSGTPAEIQIGRPPPALLPTTTTSSRQKDS